MSFTERMPPPKRGSASMSRIVRVGSETETFTWPRQIVLRPNIFFSLTEQTRNADPLMTGLRSRGVRCVMTTVVRNICSVRSQYSAALQPPI